MNYKSFKKKLMKKKENSLIQKKKKTIPYNLYFSFLQLRRLNFGQFIFHTKEFSLKYYKTRIEFDIQKENKEKLFKIFICHNFFFFLLNS